MLCLRVSMGFSKKTNLIHSCCWKSSWPNNWSVENQSSTVLTALLSALAKGLSLTVNYQHWLFPCHLQINQQMVFAQILTLHSDLPCVSDGISHDYQQSMLMQVSWLGMAVSVHYSGLGEMDYNRRACSSCACVGSLPVLQCLPTVDIEIARRCECDLKRFSVSLSDLRWRPIYKATCLDRQAPSLS